ncbi:BTB/POZ domain-containing protein At1g63850-like isoform X1 [Dioscorea cayenensis subsp. rotundata]|uniref:BTB/POZ domain-containing protein At1g63850-like isoform X1 n=1 Tax=Dioscorea cayennensis subsp. rotundata TaxID=55577 RepID=A0AB40CJ87_DIOCR|nr:BTB/POZ domain-containing protein At1g63850-like isoform X1 [Dioscorea cayenensis subsp. rotundata]
MIPSSSGAGDGATLKRKRVISTTRLSSFSDPPETLADDPPSPATPRPIPGGFNDAATADVLLRLEIEDSSSSSSSMDLHLHSSALRRCRYFATLLSDRWLPESPSPARLTLKVPSGRTFDPHLSALNLLYTLDFPSTLLSVSDALDLLPVALELLFDDLVRACVRFLEAVPWTDDEEDGVVALLPFLRHDESADLRARIHPEGPTSSEEMLHKLIYSAIHSHPKVANVKAFVAKLLRDYPSRDSVRRVLERAFLHRLATVKDLLGEYANPDFRVSGDNDETEAIQRLNLHGAVVNARHLLWLVERMIELRVGDTAVKEWSEQASLASDLQRTFRDDAWQNIAPGLSSLMMRCTCRLANAVAAGSILASRQVRMKLVKDWLPVLNVCRDIVSPMPSGHKMLYQELEETFLRIISTLPMSNAQELLQQCLSFSTRNVDDCPHLVSAFNTWFRRANRPAQDENKNNPS